MSGEQGSQDRQVLILGGGFAGLFTALHLGNAGCSLPVTVIDRNQRFVFKPLLYELLSDDIQREVVWPEYEALMADRDVTVISGEIRRIDLGKQQVELASGQICPYEYLVIALGNAVDFNVPGAREHALTFRTAEDALALKTHYQEVLQQAIATTAPQERETLLTTAIVGGGPTGVELAATLADFLPLQYEALGGNPQDIRVLLLQKDAEILPGYSGSVRTAVEKALSNRQVPVKIHLNALIEQVTAGNLQYEQDEQSHALTAATLVWTAGSITHPLIKTLPIPEVHRDPEGRPYLTSALQIIGLPNVFAGGDCAVDPRELSPATAQVAYQHGKAIAQNIMALIKGESAQPVNIKLRGTFVKSGLETSVVEILNQFVITGQAGHLARQGTYLNLLPTPARNLKLSAEWIADEVLEQFSDA